MTPLPSAQKMSLTSQKSPRYAQSGRRPSCSIHLGCRRSPGTTRAVTGRGVSASEMRGTHGQGPPRRYLPRASLAVAVPFLSVPCPRAPLPSLVLTVLLVWASDMEREEDGPQRMRNGRVENRPPLAGEERRRGWGLHWHSSFVGRP